MGRKHVPRRIFAKTIFFFNIKEQGRCNLLEILSRVLFLEASILLGTGKVQSFGKIRVLFLSILLSSESRSRRFFLPIVHSHTANNLSLNSDKG